MLYKVSNLLVNLLVGKKSIDGEKREVYIYGAMLFISTFTGLLSLFLVSIVFFDLVTFLVFVVFFVPLRLYAGGYHCSTYGSCFVVSILLFLSVVLCAKATYLIAGIPTVFSVITALVVLAFSPVSNRSNPLSQKQRKINRKYSLYIVISQVAIINILTSLHLEFIDYYIGLGACCGLSIAMLMIIEIIIERRRKNA